MNDTTIEEQAVESEAVSKPTVANPALLLAPCHNVLGFVSEDPSRYMLMGLHYNPKAQVIEATDGRMLIRVPALLDKHGEFPPAKDQGGAAEAIIPAAPLKKAFASAAKRETLPILQAVRVGMTLDKDGAPAKATLTTTDLDTEQALTAKVIEGQYPDVEQCLPTSEPIGQVALSAQLLNVLCEYAKKHARKAGEHSPVKLVFYGELKPVGFEVQVEALGEPLTAAGAIMPIKME